MENLARIAPFVVVPGIEFHAVIGRSGCAASSSVLGGLSPTEGFASPVGGTIAWGAAVGPEFADS
jgi:hypothetical protein